MQLMSYFKLYYQYITCSRSTFYRVDSNATNLLILLIPDPIFVELLSLNCVNIVARIQRVVNLDDEVSELDEN